MIDPSWLGSASAVVIGTAVGLAARRVIATFDRHDEPEHEQPRPRVHTPSGARQ